MNSQSITTIEFDPQLLNKYSAEQLVEQQARIGFYKKENNSYVLTTTTCQKQIKLETSIKKIANLLQQRAIINLPNFSSHQDIFKTTQYLDTISRVISKYNNNASKNSDHKIVKFLSTIPLINRIVSWYFKPINQPTDFIQLFIQQQKNAMALQFEGAEGVQALSQRKEELLRAFREARQTQTCIKGLELRTLWQEEENLIQKTYESLVQKSVPALCLAQHILSVKSQESEKTYREILELTDDEDVKKAPNICNQVLKKLILDPSIQNLIPTSLRDSLRNAIELVKNAYSQWHSQRILALYNKKENPSIQEILGVEDPNKYLEKYLSLSERLKSQQPTNVTASEKLQQSFKEYLEFEVDELIKECSQPDFIFNQTIAEKYQVLLNQLEKTGPLAVHILKKLKEFYEDSYANYMNLKVANVTESLSHSFSTFNEARELKDMLGIYQQKWNIFQEWAKIHEKRLPADQLNSSLLNFQACLNEAYKREIQQRIPLYAESCKLLSQKETDTTDALVVIASSSISLNKTELWYQHKKQLFEYAMTELDQEDVLPEIYQSIQQAYKKIIADYSKFKEEELKYIIKPKIPKSIFSQGFQKISDWFKNDNGDKFPLNVYQEYLINLLEFKNKEVTSNQIQTRYEEKITLLKSLSSKEAITILEEAYGRYQKLLQVQPLLRKIVKKDTLSFEDLFPNVDEKTNVSTIEQKKDEILQIIQEEIEIQSQKNNKNILKTLEKLRININNLWIKYLDEKYAQYLPIKQILQQVKERKEHYYIHILHIDQFGKSDVAYSKMENLLKDIDIPNLETYPVNLQKDYLEAQQWITIAYKEWEADRILRVAKNSYITEREILGLSSIATGAEVKKQYRKLQLLLHPDKCGSDLPNHLREKFANSCKMLSTYCGSGS